MLRKGCLLAAVVFLALILAGCGNTPVPTPTPTPTALLTITPPPIDAPTVTMVTSPLLSRIFQLPAGQYLIFRIASGSDDTNWGIISLDGEYKARIADTSEDIIGFSGDGVHVISWRESRMLDLQTGNYEPLPDFAPNCQEMSLSPDTRNWIGFCVPEDVSSMEIYDLTGDKPIALTDCAAHMDFCSGPSWSPDGGWITYFQSPAGAYQGHETGMFIMSADCLTHPADCEASASGPFDVSFFSWSPDGLSLATLWWDGSMVIYGFDQGRLSLSNSFMLDADDWPIAWSPDGEWIAYSFSNSIYLSSPNGDQTRLLLHEDADVVVVRWIEIPER